MTQSYNDAHNYVIKWKWNIWFSHVSIKTLFWLWLCRTVSEHTHTHTQTHTHLVSVCDGLSGSPVSRCVVSTSCVWDICFAEGQMWCKECEAEMDGWAETSREYQCAASCLCLCLPPPRSLVPLQLRLFVRLSWADGARGSAAAVLPNICVVAAPEKKRTQTLLHQVKLKTWSLYNTSLPVKVESCQDGFSQGDCHLVRNPEKRKPPASVFLTSHGYWSSSWRQET